MRRWPWWALIGAGLAAQMAYRLFVRLELREERALHWVGLVGVLVALFVFYGSSAELFSRWYPRLCRRLTRAKTAE